MCDLVHGDALRAVNSKARWLIDVLVKAGVLEQRVMDTVQREMSRGQRALRRALSPVLSPRL